MAVRNDVTDAGELAELVADLRAVLEHARLRGLLAEDPLAPLPEPVVEARDAAWASLAVEARSRAEEVATTGADGLQRVRDDLGDCRRCGLCAARKTIVFGVGDPEADLVVIGEAPGYHEDVQGEPFVGPAGQMLDRMLENVLGLPRSQVYICNVIKCRPPENRNPLPPEVDACMPFLRRQIGAIRPKLLLVLGTVAYKALFGGSRGIKAARGVWHEFEGIPALPTFHPAYLLRQPDDKRIVFEDLKVLRSRYDSMGGRRRT